jgi:hypothetical protein
MECINEIAFFASWTAFASTICGIKFKSSSEEFSTFFFNIKNSSAANLEPSTKTIGHFLSMAKSTSTKSTTFSDYPQRYECHHCRQNSKQEGFLPPDFQQFET